MRKMNQTVFARKSLTVAITVAIAMVSGAMAAPADATIAATHIYHNHMPNFWPYYDTSSYATTPVGGEIRYAYDGQARKIKLAPPENYTYFLPSGAPMPHDALDTYYSHNAKQEAYSSWPAETAKANNAKHPLSQTQVTMSAAVVNNIQSFAEDGVLNFSIGWAQKWRDTVGSLKTTNGFNALEPIHFTGHHSMGPLVGPKYFLKDLIYQNVTLQRDYFLGSKFKSSKGFFPTELGFSERLIPTLSKLGIEWSVLGNNHFSRALRDYPYLDYPAKDTMVSPPNRADMQNTYDAGQWVDRGMAHEQQRIVNKFPFCSIPHWVQYVDPETGEITKVAGIPVDQNSSWQEGWDGAADAIEMEYDTYVAAANGRVQFHVIAHDGDNSSGRAGSWDTWMASGSEYSVEGVTGMGVEEYLKAYPIPEDDVQHVQDGSWVDTRDSSSDPDWYHWHIPMGVWKGQFADFNTALGTEFEVPVNHNQQPFGHAVSMEYGYHYLERNFALLQAAINYAETAEQIWLDGHPNYWSPSTDAEKQVTYAGNQLNPYMFSYPVKGDEANDYKGGANPAELGWYFLIASIDSGFGYYDENTDDNVKPTLSFNQSLFFTEPYVEKNLSKDKTGPSMWWVQRYPTNPGSANSGKAEGWTTAYADNTFVIYTYAYDVSGIDDVTVYIRPHKADRMGPTDIAPRVYEPKKFAGKANVDVDQVGEWKAYPTKMRDLTPDINGVAWQNSAPNKNYAVVPGQKIGNTYYAYINDYRDQLVDYYMEAKDKLGNVTKSEIQHTYVGAGRYKKSGDLMVEDVNGDIEGVHMFFSDGMVVLQDKVTVFAQLDGSTSGFIDFKDKATADWNSKEMKAVANSSYYKTTVEYTRDAGCADVRVRSAGADKYIPSAEGKCLAKGTYTIAADGSITEGAPADLKGSATIYFKPSSSITKACLHYRDLPQTGDKGWTTAPGITMDTAKDGWFKSALELPPEATGIEFLFNDCGSNWYKSSSGGNFTTSTIEDIQVNGTSMKSGSPFEDDVVVTPPVDKPPVAVIKASADSIKAGESVKLDGSQSTDDKGIASYKWTVNGTTVSTDKVFTATPEKDTTYTLTVTDTNGASATKSVTIKVQPIEDIQVKVLPDFDVSIDNLTVAFSNKSSVVEASEDSMTSSWDFGDGSKSTDANPEHTYAKAGSYDVVLTVKAVQNGKVLASDTKKKTVTVDPIVIVPVEVEIVASKTKIKNGESVTLEAKATGDNITYLWNNGSTDKEIVVSPEVTTTYTVTATSANGTKDTKSVKIIVDDDQVVTNNPPVVNVSVAPATTVAVGTKVTLDASASTDADGDELTFYWEQTKEATAKIVVDANEVGTYVYTVTVTDSQGAQTQKSVQLKVVDIDANVSPVAKLAPATKQIIKVGDTIDFSAAGSIDDKGVVSYTWFVGNKQQNNQSDKFTFTATEEGNFNVIVVVTDEEGLKSSTATKVVVSNAGEDDQPIDFTPSVKAKITGSLYTAIGDPFTFSASKSTAAHEDVVIAGWEIDGVPIKTLDETITIPFTTSGLHIVSLTVRGSKSKVTNTTNYKVYVNSITHTKVALVVDGKEVSADTDVTMMPSMTADKDNVNIATDLKNASLTISKFGNTVDELQDCTVSNTNVVECGADATGKSEIAVNSSLAFAEEGLYNVQVNGFDTENNEVHASTTLKVQEQAALPDDDSDTTTTNPGDADTDTSSGSSKGGSLDFTYLLGLVALALGLRRRTVKK